MKSNFQNQRPSFQVPKRNWIRRNPRAFQIGVLTVSMLSFFSKPLYDCFIRDDFVPAASPRPSRN